MIHYDEIIQYFDNLVTQSTQIQDFFRFDITEIQGALRAGIQFPCLALEAPQGSFQGSSPANSVVTQTLAFTIYIKPENDSQNAQNDALVSSQAWGLSVVKRLRYDSADSSSPWYNIIDLASIDFFKVGPIFSDRLFGYRFEIELKPQKIDMKVEPAFWSDVSDPCP